MNTKGFTLIELLVVIAIIAVLAVVVILTLNPAELLRQARDSNRVSDLGTLKSVLSIFETDVATSNPAAIGAYGILYLNDKANSATSTYVYNINNPIQTWGYATTSVLSALTTTLSVQRNVDGTGWIPVNLKAITSGAPIGSLPVDPSDNISSTYAFAASSTVFKLSATMESAKYSTGGGGDVESNDGGTSTSTYETGSKLTL